MNQGALVNLFLGGVIALLPLYLRVSWFDFSRTSKDNLLTAIFTVLCVLLPNQRRRTPWHLWGVLAYTIPAVVLNHWDVISVTVMLQTFYFVAGMAFFVAYYQRHDKQTVHYVLNGMAIGCLIQSFLALCEYFGFPLYQNIVAAMANARYVRGNDTLIGSLGNSNLLASYLAISSFALFRKGWWKFLALAIPALLLTESIMGIAAFIGGSAFYLNHKHKLLPKYALYIAASALMVVLFFTGVGGQDSQRFWAWGEIFKRVDLHHFLIGKGPGWFSDLHLKLHNGIWMAQEHNSFISAFNMFGAIGLLIAFPLAIWLIRKKDESPLIGAALFAAFCNSYGHFTFHQSTVAIIIIVLAGISLAEGNKYELDMEW